MRQAIYSREFFSSWRFLKNISMNALEYFQLTFPSQPVAVFVDELKYKCNTEYSGRLIERFAQRFIMRKGIPATADLEVWSVGGIVKEVSLVVKAAPEEYDFADEVPDTEGLDGGWWNTEQE